VCLLWLAGSRHSSSSSQLAAASQPCMPVLLGGGLHALGAPWYQLDLVLAQPRPKTPLIHVSLMSVYVQIA
jgi:hypothetical protein